MSDQLNIRQQRLLMFLAADESPIDPIRIMKGMFIFEMKAPDSWQLEDAHYHFTPYNYGPFSPEVYRDLEHLQVCNFVKIEQAANRSWNYYRITTSGKDIIKSMEHTLGTAIADYLVVLRRFVSDLSFRDLLEAVYKAFPDYAVNSVFR